MEEAGGSGLQGQEAGHAEGKKKEALTDDDPEIARDAEGSQIVVSEEDEATSLPLTNSHRVYAPLVVLLENVTQPKKKSRRAPTNPGKN